jgi:anti-sigma regulatory factor (Ser/Thr protein kinase)
MAGSIRIAIEEASQTAEARRMARRMALNIGFDQVRGEHVAIAVTEACTNILKHAGRGEVVLGHSDDNGHEHGPELEFLALDQGPGIGNLERCLRDGYTTSNTPGHGLGAITRLSNTADFYSVPGKGMALLARWWFGAGKNSEARNPPHLVIGAVNVSKRGQEVCGDAWGVEQCPSASTVLLADGLGHGYEASVAAAEAVRVLHANPGLMPAALVELAHRALHSSRGAAVAVARIDRARREVIFAGVGNIMGQIYAGAQRAQHVVSVNGTVGLRTQGVREFTYAWPDNGVLVLHSDGLSTSAGLDQAPGLALRDPSLIAGVLYRDFGRAYDDATVVVAKAG